MEEINQKEEMMKRYFTLFALLISGCSSSQFTYYQASSEEEPWRVTVENSPLETFECLVDDSSVVTASFTAFWGGYDSFEKDGLYEGKLIKLSGFRTAHESTDLNGVKTTTYSYQIRIFIDKEEIAIFNF